MPDSRPSSAPSAISSTMCRRSSSPPRTRRQKAWACLLDLEIRPHLAISDNEPKESPARRFCGNVGYKISQVLRKRVEETFGWAKTVGGLRRTLLSGRTKTWHAGYYVMGAKQPDPGGSPPLASSAQRRPEPKKRPPFGHRSPLWSHRPTLSIEKAPARLGNWNAADHRFFSLRSCCSSTRDLYARTDRERDRGGWQGATIQDARCPCHEVPALERFAQVSVIPDLLIGLTGRTRALIVPTCGSENAVQGDNCFPTDA